MTALPKNNLWGLLKKIFPFADAKDLDFLCKNCSFEKYAAGDIVSSVSTSDTDLYCIISGTVDIVSDLSQGERFIFQSFSANSFIGELEFFSNGKRLATGIAKTEAQIIVFPRHQTLEFFLSNKEFMLYLLKVFFERYKTKNTDLLSAIEQERKTTKFMAIMSEQAALAKLAQQVAHDIRSPLAALDSIIKDLSQLPEEKRIIMRSAMGRIRDIANNLIEKNRQLSMASRGENDGISSSDAAMSIQLLSSLIDPLITEKRLQFRARMGIEIDFQLGPESYGVFANIQPRELKRMLSNLINNSVEALNGKGSIILRLERRNNLVEITVQDSGKGIPAGVIEKLGQRGATFGKAEGSGLGLYHAKTTIESWGGSLKIQSEQGAGTNVTLRLPLSIVPEWFVSEVKLVSALPVVVLDDDTSIHLIWQGRFDSLGAKNKNIEILHFSAPDELRNWVLANSPIAKQTLYLVDYELLGYKDTGLSLAEELGIGERSILVTSRYEEQQIIENCIRLRARVIPKGLAGVIPISIGAVNEADPEKKTTKAVLIDDDPLVHMTWKVAARSAGVVLQPFKNPADFFAVCKILPKETPIYIDSDLGDGQKGEEIAKAIYERGFKTIYLETGHQPGSLPGMPWIKEIISKEPPW
jgi:signal transduction histidine kinase